MQSEVRKCVQCALEFTLEADDFSFYEKMGVPAPTFCPLCRVQRRFAFRNEGSLFKVKSYFTGKEIFSLWPKTGRKVVTQEEWFSDKWSGFDYGREYDFSRPFFEQLFELEKEVPIYNLNVQMMVGSPYSGNATSLKNCYLVFNSNFSENCLYGNAIDYCKDCVDNSHIKNSEKCYQSFWLENCYQCYYTIMSAESRNLWFSRDCIGCSDCFGCSNLRNTKYHIFNKKYTKEEYEEKLTDMRLNTREGLQNAMHRAREFWQTQPVKNHQGIKNVNSSGSYVSNCKNVKEGYLIRESEDLKYCQYLQVPGNKDCHDASIWGNNVQLCYETCICGEGPYNLKFCLNCWPECQDLEYCINMKNSSDCFACVGLKNAKYCIFNKQFKKDEYYELKQRIIDHMNQMPYQDAQGIEYKYGEFFPAEFSAYGYNNSLAMEHFPLSKEEIEARGYPWLDKERGDYNITMNAEELPDSIDDVSDKILKEVIACDVCGYAFKVHPTELTFLKSEKLPIPSSCPDCRKQKRLSDRLTVRLFSRDCMCTVGLDESKVYKNTSTHEHGNKKCKNSFRTGYEPEGEEIVYCEDCYRKEVY